MLLGLESYLRYHANEKITGTLAVIDGPTNFRKTDGFIQFMKLAMDQIPIVYGKQHPDWQKCINSIYKTAEKLRASNTVFDGTSEDFPGYCDRISQILKKDTNPLDILRFDIMTGDDLEPFMRKHIQKGNIRGFHYDPEEDAEKGLMKDLMEQLSNIKFSKDGREYDISRYLTTAKYHEHVHDALNLLMSTAVYAINCGSTRAHEAYGFDIQKVENDLHNVEFIIERTKYVK